jgi:hypothetical protein
VDLVVGQEVLVKEVVVETEDTDVAAAAAAAVVLP